MSDSVRIQPIPEAPSRPLLLLRGFTRRCAWCGDRKAYFSGWFRRLERCQACGHSYRRGDHAFDLGATTINMILSLGIVLVLILVFAVFAGGLSPWAIVAVLSIAGLGAPLILYPVSFTIWQAIDIWMRQPTEAELKGEADATL